MADPGTVYLVGAGPGDPGLLTLKGRDCLACADVVVYDHLANVEILGHARDDAEMIYVGKQAGRHSMPQEEINALLVEKGLEGKTVVRLKGGDPYVFGRGGEEALELREAGVPFEVVPGITAGVAAAAYAGIPVTHRGFNSAVTLVTGHEDPTKPESALDWSALAKGAGTLAIYMGVKNLPLITQKLINGGRPPETPVALIRWGTHPTQRVVDGTLANIVERVREAKLTPPCIIVVGEVVKLRNELNWFESRPLFGKTVLVTRSRQQASDLAAKLAALGARVLIFPTIRIEPPLDDQPLERAVASLADFDWIIFTSANGVESFFSMLDGLGRDGRCLANCKVCSIGPGTTARLSLRGIRPDLVPERFTTQAVFDALSEANEVKGNRFLRPRADIAGKALPQQLRDAGAEVTDIEAYRTLRPTPDPETIEALRAGEVDIVTFTSSST